MISAADVSSCRNASSLAALFERLGYPVDVVPLDPHEWRRMGVDPGLRPDDRLLSLCRLGALWIYVVESECCARERCAARTRRLQELNSVLKIVVINICCQHDEITIHDIDTKKRCRRLDVSLLSARPHEIDRLNLLERVSRQQTVSPSELFDRALSRERVTRQFFARFRNSVDRLAAAIGNATAEPKDVAAAEALLVLSRVLFLYFVQQKGWLDRNRRFLLDQFERTTGAGKDFFSSALLTLFFGCLNTPRSRRSAKARSLGVVPYLNGGLFNPSPFEVRHPSFAMPNELWRDILENTFEAFTFCLDEADTDASHVDPEMLGNVFESLMACDERLSSGSFYTPRTIADSLARTSIVHWVAGGNDALAARIGALLAGEEPAIEPAVALLLLDRVRETTILDPACGSGAFLLAALRVLERLTQRLGAIAGIRIPSDLRQAIVERSLFGVDLKPEAVRLCELRLWLAIVSNSEAGIDDVPPLPNLDRNILQGNSLLGPLDAFAAGRLEIYREWSFALRGRQQLADAYRRAAPQDRPAIVRAMRTSDRDLAVALVDRAIAAEEREIASMLSDATLFPGARPVKTPVAVTAARKRIASHREIRKRLERGELQFFSFDVHFAHLLADGGFSVVLGNPPWVRAMRIDPELRRMYAERFEVFSGGRAEGGGAFPQSDLSLIFVERALALAKKDGVVSMLLPSKFLNAGYAAKLRRRLLATTRIVRIDDWTSEARRLFDADTFPLGLTVAPSDRRGAHGVVLSARGADFTVEQSDLKAGPETSAWSLVAPDARRILGRLFERFPPLHVTLNRMPLMGVKTGSNSRFFLGNVALRDEGAYLEDLGVQVPLSAICRAVRGRDIRRWRSRDSVWMLWPPLEGFREPPAWVVRLAEALGVEPSDVRLSYAKPEHLGIKVGWKDVSRGLQAVVLPESVSIAGRDIPLVPNQTVYSLDAVTMDEAFCLSAILNSTIAGALAVSVAERAKDCHHRYLAQTVARIPLPAHAVRGDMAHRLVRIARRAHLTGVTPAELDEIVGGLYEVSGKEREILARYLRTESGGVDAEAR